MKTKWYRSAPIKGLMLLIAHISAVAGALCLAGLLFLLYSNVELLSPAESYWQSSSFAKTLYEDSYSILSGLKPALPITKNSSGEDIVKLETVLEDGEISEAENPVAFSDTSAPELSYSVSDLKAWTEKGWDYINYSYVTPYSSDDPDYMILVCQKPDHTYEYMYCSDFLKKIERGELVPVMNDSSESPDALFDDPRLLYGHIAGRESGGIARNMGVASIKDSNGSVVYNNVWSYDGDSIHEAYRPQNGNSILDILNTNPEWNDKIDLAFLALNDTLDQISMSVRTDDTLKQHSEGNTNLTYLYADHKGRKIYTNNHSFLSYGSLEDSLKEIQEEQAYVIINPVLSECETNIMPYLSQGSLHLISSPDLTAWQHTISGCGISDDYTFAALVDTAFPISDQYAENAQLYERFSRFSSGLIPGLGFAVVFFLISFVWLTVVSGRRPGDEEVHLCGFDRIATEIAAFSVILLCLSGCAVLVEGVSWRVRGDEDILILAGLLAAYVSVLFFIGYLSLVRRIKAHTLWKNSVLRWMLRLLKKMGKKSREFLELFSRNTSSKLRTLLLLGAFFLLMFCIHGAIFAGGIYIMLFLLVLTDAAVLVYFLKKADGMDILLDGVKRIAGGELQYKIPKEKLLGEQKVMAEHINTIGSGLDAAVEKSLADERMKTELITNVSHDLKTPLTSIINYVDLLQRENFTDPKIQGYLDILTEKSQRLKTLTEDVVEASKASTGNITLNMTDLDFIEMLHQVMAEFEDRFQERHLSMMVHFTDEPSIIRADGRYMWRVMENIFGNVSKYAMENTRVYAEVKKANKRIIFTLKNISAQPLNISADELTERFIRGDVSRNTEGSGLGLSIAKSLTELQGGEFKLYVDGDLFKVMIVFTAQTADNK